MPKFERIVVGIDFSPASLAALDRAVAIAGSDARVLHAVHAYVPLAAVPRPVMVADLTGPLESALIEDRTRELREVVAGRCRSGVTIDVQVVAGPPADSIVREASEHAADLIAVGTSGRTGLPRFLLGSVAERVIRIAPVDVLAVPASAARAEVRPPKTIVCGIDFSGASESAFVTALSIARAHGAAIHAVHAWSADVYAERRPELARLRESELSHELDALVRRHATAEDGVQTHVQSGPAYAAIVQCAAKFGADLTVVGALGSSAFDHFLLGSVAERTVRASEVPVLCVRARAT